MMFVRSCNLCVRSTNRLANQLQKRTNKVLSHTPVYHVFPMELKQKQPEKPKKIPVITTCRKEFNFNLGDKYVRKHGQKNLISHGWLSMKSKGDYFVIHPLPEDEMMIDDDSETSRFSDFKLNPDVLKELQKIDIEEPTKIQRLAIPEILAGSNTLLAAETGCGKTLAYLLPLLEQVSHWKEKLSNRNENFNSPYALIITPTRELAEQIGVEARRLTKVLGISVKTITNKRGKDLLQHPPVDDVDIVVGSFGLLHKLVGVNIYKLDNVRHVVLDEADALLHETFDYKLQNFLHKMKLNYNNESAAFEDTTGHVVQLTLASATMPRRMPEVLSEIVNVNNIRTLTTENLHRIRVPQKFIRVGPGQKATELLKYLKPKLAQKQHVIIFSNENRTCDWTKHFLESASIDTVCINGAMSLTQRRGLYNKFLSGEIRILTTTNAGSRGLDTTMVKHVLNYNFPFDTADYVHRCGRTGRLGSEKHCSVTSFVSSARDVALVRKIERAARENKPIPLVDTSHRDPDIEEQEKEDIDDHYDHLESLVIDSEQDSNVPY